MVELLALLVEDDPDACKCFADYADDLDDFRLISITNNSAKALQDIQDYLPNVVILDLELHQGGGSGLDVLRGIPQLHLSAAPYILVTTNNTSSITYEYARKMGADYIFYKGQEGYSPAEAVDFLRMMKNVILSKKKLIAQQQTTESPHQHKQRIVRRIDAELNQVGISPKAKGYQYLVDAISLVIEQPRTGLCNIIGQMHGCTEASVERAMQNAINKAWRTTDIEELLTHFTAKIHSEKGVPTITEFVYYYANKIRNEY